MQLVVAMILEFFKNISPSYTFCSCSAALQTFFKCSNPSSENPGSTSIKAIPINDFNYSWHIKL